MPNKVAVIFWWYQRLVDKRNSAGVLYLAFYRSFGSDKKSTMQNQYHPYLVDLKWSQARSQKIAVNSKLSSAKLFLMSFSQGGLCFQCSSQGRRRLLPATARDDKNRGAVNNNMGQVSGREWPGGQQSQKSRRCGSKSDSEAWWGHLHWYGGREGVINNPFNIGPRDALAVGGRTWQ